MKSFFASYPSLFGDARRRIDPNFEARTSSNGKLLLMTLKRRLLAIPPCGREARMGMSGRVCGVDVGRDSLVAPVIGGSLKESEQFVNDADGINRMKEWLQVYECARAATTASSFNTVTSAHCASKKGEISVSATGSPTTFFALYFRTQIQN